MLVKIAVAALALAATQAAETPLKPTDAIARAEAQPDRSLKLTVAMTVVSAERTLKGVFLNSTDDYRRPDDVTMRLTFPVADAIAKQLGAPPEVALKGKRIVVRGVLARISIVNTVSGRAHSFNRVQHQIVVHERSQIVSLG